jgi:hypothetical protein
MKAKLVGINAIKPKANVNTVGKDYVVEKVMKIRTMFVNSLERMRRSTDVSKVNLSMLL